MTLNVERDLEWRCSPSSTPSSLCCSPTCSCPTRATGFAVAREAARQWPHIAIMVASGHVQPEPGDMPEGAHFIAKPFSARMVHDHLREILPDGQKPETLRD
ncbi:response regulator [Methylobacterium oxalidis]|uniref:Response regulatory domain-containing protein n=1 Tax=Methylobacterium oxalidis TaxID=944322 RepID=A0ABQ6DH94_9HYPH|nr:response regulator [Methylobacterium oxalidis]GLS63842.1 hypothetical protein GCM10007888_22230 [Methylobacterium oxalidis]